MRNLPTNLSNLKSKADRLDVDNLVPVLVDLSKLSDVVKNDVVKKDIEDKTPDVTNLAINFTLNAKINAVKKRNTSITNLATTTPLNAVENKIPNISNLLKKIWL